MSIRPFTQQDWPAIFDIYAHSKLDELTHEKQAFQLVPLDQDAKRFPELKESEIFVYESNNKVVAYAARFKYETAKTEKPKHEIRALFVHPSYRNQNIARQLLDFLLSKTSGQTDLYVAKSNVAAKALYKKFGFEISHEFETEYAGMAVMANKMIRKGPSH